MPVEAEEVGMLIILLQFLMHLIMVEPQEVLEVVEEEVKVSLLLILLLKQVQLTSEEVEGEVPIVMLLMVPQEVQE